MNLWISLTNKYFLGALSFDAPQPWQILFQDAATKIMDNITNLHHDIMLFPEVIGSFCASENFTQFSLSCWILSTVKMINRYPNDGTWVRGSDSLWGPTGRPTFADLAMYSPTNSEEPVVPTSVPDPGMSPESAALLLGQCFQTSIILLVIGACVWNHYKKKAVQPEQVDITELRLRAEKVIPSSLPEGENKDYSSWVDRVNLPRTFSYSDVKITEDGFEIRGVPLKLSVIPFICLTSCLKETFTALFCALLRKGCVYLVRQQITVFLKAFLFGKVKNAFLLFFATTWAKNLSKIRPLSQSITIKTKIVILFTAHHSSLLFKKIRLSESRMG